MWSTGRLDALLALARGAVNRLSRIRRPASDTVRPGRRARELAPAPDLDGTRRRQGHEVALGTPVRPPQTTQDPGAISGKEIYTLNSQIQRLKRNVSRLEAIHKLSEVGRTPVYPVEFRSQFGEDAVLWEILEGQLDGFFIEVGAFDGYNHSVTYALECLGWEGLLVEAIPERAEQCRARRRNSRVVHAALAATPGGETSFTVTEDLYGGMLSYLDPNARHAKGAASATRRTVTVPLTTMNELLNDHHGEIDVVVIDVEGGEIPLLAGFDLHKYRPKIIVIEDNTRGADLALVDHMSMMPYKQVAWLEINRVYVRTDLAPQITRRIRP